jgi:hypothetical protein
MISMSAVYFFRSKLGIFSLKFWKNQRGFLALGMVLFIGTTYTREKIADGGVYM